MATSKVRHQTARDEELSSPWGTIYVDKEGNVTKLEKDGKSVDPAELLGHPDFVNAEDFPAAKAKKPDAVAEVETPSKEPTPKEPTSKK